MNLIALWHQPSAKQKTMATDSPSPPSLNQLSSQPEKFSSRPALPQSPQSKTPDQAPSAACAAQTAQPLHACQTSSGCTSVPRVPGHISTLSRSSLSLQAID